MIKIIPFEKRDQYPRLFDDMFRMRHKLYVEGRKIRHWGSADGRERDTYDTDGIIYMFALNLNGELEGGLRLIPTVKPHLLLKENASFCSFETAPQREDTWEMSRIFVAGNSRFSSVGAPLKGVLFCAMVSYARHPGVQYITGLNDSFFLPRVLECGLVVSPLGLPKPTEWGEFIAYKILLDDNSLQKALSYYQVPTAALEITDITTVNNETKPYLLDKKDSVFTQLQGRKTHHLRRMADIVPRLGSANPDIAAIAELELDKLIYDVRQDMIKKSSFSGGSCQLN